MIKDRDKEHPIENLMQSTMENLKDMIDVNTIIGDPVETKDGTCIIPISKVSFGFASGGSEFDSQNKVSSDFQVDYPFAGGSGAGVSVKPVSFLVVRKDAVRLLPVEQDNTYDRIVDTVPQILEMFKDVCKDFKEKRACKKEEEEKNCCSEYHTEECCSTPKDSPHKHAHINNGKKDNSNSLNKETPTKNIDGFDVK